MSQIAHGCRPALETLISAGWIEVHVERIAREANRDRVVGRYIDSGQTRAVDALDCHLLRFDRKVVVLGLAEHIGANIFIRFLQIGAVHHRDSPEVVCKAVIGQHGRSYLKKAHKDGRDRKKTQTTFDNSHNLKLRETKAQRSGLGSQHPLKMFYD
jgi:hypothetical protein